MVCEVAIISGKGGTGKTTIAAAFVAISENLVMADCDVDAPDLHILLKPDVKHSEDFISSKVASIDTETCTNCDLCRTSCRFDAANPPEINPIACEGCGVCEYICPERAISMHDKVSGKLFESKTSFGDMVHARLLPGEGNSGKLVTEVRKRSVKFAENKKNGLVLIDGSPGIGCPVIATVTGLCLGIVVTEPTFSGIHDMKRVLDLMKELRVKPLVIINKYDLNTANSQSIERFCQEQDIEILGTLPFNPIMTESMIAGMTLPEFSPQHKIVKSLERMWKRVENIAFERH